MTNIVWPAALPDSASWEDYQESMPDMVIRTAMDAGPAKVRRRFSAAPTSISGTMLMNSSQVATLDAFFRDSTAGGSLAFSWTHPRTGAEVACRFLSPPQLRHVAGPLWRVELAIEILP